MTPPDEAAGEQGAREQPASARDVRGGFAPAPALRSAIGGGRPVADPGEAVAGPHEAVAATGRPGGPDVTAPDGVAPDARGACRACGAPLERRRAVRVECEACAAPYHRACARALRGCAAPGCAGRPDVLARGAVVAARGPRLRPWALASTFTGVTVLLLVVWFVPRAHRAWRRVAGADEREARAVHQANRQVVEEVRDLVRLERAAQQLERDVERVGDPADRQWAAANRLVERLEAEPALAEWLVPPLLARYRGADALTRERAGYVLGELGKRAGWRPPAELRPAFLRALEDPEPRVRDRAASVVVYLGPEVLAAVAALAEDASASPEARAAAREALERAGRVHGTAHQPPPASSVTRTRAPAGG